MIRRNNWTAKEVTPPGYL